MVVRSDDAGLSHGVDMALERLMVVGAEGYTSCCFGAVSQDPQYRATPTNKPDSLVALVGRLQDPYSVLVTHVGIDDAELGAMQELNTDGGLSDMSRNRQGELDALLSPQFRRAPEARGVRLLTYSQLIEMLGLQAMKRPGV